MSADQQSVVTDDHWEDGRYNGMTFEEYVAKAKEVLATNRRIEDSLRHQCGQLEAQYLDAFDQVTGFVGAIQDVRARYPEDVFPPDGTSSDAAGARFARTLCDEIERLAEMKTREITRSRHA